MTWWQHPAMECKTRLGVPDTTSCLPTLLCKNSNTIYRHCYSAICLTMEMLYNQHNINNCCMLHWNIHKTERTSNIYRKKWNLFHSRTHTHIHVISCSRALYSTTQPANELTKYELNSRTVINSSPFGDETWSHSEILACVAVQALPLIGLEWTQLDHIHSLLF